MDEVNIETLWSYMSYLSILGNSANRRLTDPVVTPVPRFEEIRPQ